jgi:hypothetical protein
MGTRNNALSKRDIFKKENMVHRQFTTNSSQQTNSLSDSSPETIKMKIVFL